MVTPRKPGAKRGRPSLAWADDPERFAIACLAALDAFDAVSSKNAQSPSFTKASEIVSMLMLGEQVGELSAEVEQRYQGMVGVQFQKTIGSRNTTTTFKSRAAALRKKYRAAERDPIAKEWIIAMAGIVMLLIGAKDRDRVKQAALQRAAAIGEEEKAFVRDVLLRSL